MMGPRQKVAAKSKGKTHSNPQRRVAAFHELQPFIGIQGLDLYDAREMQAKNDEHRAHQYFQVFPISDHLAKAATGLGQMVHEYRKYLEWVAGAVIIIFGLHLTGIIKIKALYADKRLHSVKGGKSPLGAFAVGFAFAFGWTPCLEPLSPPSW